MPGLTITRLDLRDVRNFDQLTIEPDGSLTVLVGPNGAGKTNVVEAIQLVTAAAAFRNPVWADVIRWGAPVASISMWAEGDARERRTVALRLDRAGKRMYEVNGSPARRISDVRGALPAVLFTPDDLRIVKDAADRRRAAVDEIGVQLSAGYAALRADYERVLKQRNVLLREDHVDDAQLQVWTERLVDVGGRFAAHRIRLFERVAGHAEHTYAQIADGERLSATYDPSWAQRGEASGESEAGKLQAELGRALESRSGEERARRTTVAGPHRDDVVFEIDGREARSFASQGQQRTIALAWKLAQVATVEEIGGGEPVLLLDDVMSELDEARRARLTEVVKTRAQTFITTTTPGYFADELLKEAKVIDLS